jgi:hypothetical protein
MSVDADLRDPGLGEMAQGYEGCLAVRSGDD